MNLPLDLIAPAAKRAIRNIDFSSLRKTAAPHLARLAGGTLASPALFGAVFGGGFLAGALAGATLSPSSGPELRARMREETLSLWNRLQKGILAPKATVGEVADALTSESKITDGSDTTDEGDTTDEEVPNDPDDLHAMKVEQLYDIAKQRDIDGRSTMNKSTLVDAIARDRQG